MVAAKPLPATPRPAIPAPAEGSLVRAASCELAQWVATRCVRWWRGWGLGRSVNLDIATVTLLCALCSCTKGQESRVLPIFAAPPVLSLLDARPRCDGLRRLWERVFGW
jgi:hypothetical protein